MKRLISVLFLCSLFCSSVTFSQNLVFTRNGMRSVDNVLDSQIVYQYKDGITKKDFRKFLVLCLSQPEFFIYKVDYADDDMLKLVGNVKNDIKHEQFCLNIVMEDYCVTISSDLLDKNGKKMNCDSFFTKKGVIKSIYKKYKSNLEDQMDELIRSMMEMRVVIY